ncbi:MAG: hypothetical protein ABR955_02965 [Verrucomicrobiota bacterium]|jgi:hypothetical protein
MKTKNIIKLTALSAAIMIAGMAQSNAAIVSTNTVQSITVAFTLYSQGTTTTNDHHAVITAVNTATVDTKSFITNFLDSTNVFKNPNLVLVVRNNGSTNPVDAFEIRDGTNPPVVVTGLSTTNSPSVNSRNAPTNGIVTGVKYSIFSFNATSSADTNDTYSLSGFTSTTHASIKVGDAILSVDKLTADVAGTYKTNGVFDAVVDGRVTLGGFVYSKTQ